MKEEKLLKCARYVVEVENACTIRTIRQSVLYDQAARTDPHARRVVNASISYLEGYKGRQNKTGQRMILCVRANIGDT